MTIFFAFKEQHDLDIHTKHHGLVRYIEPKRCDDVFDAKVWKRTKSYDV